MRSIFFLSLMNGSAWGGSEEFWFRTALWMSRNNYTIGVACFDWKEKKDRIDLLAAAGCNIYLLPNKKGLFKKQAIKKVLRAIPFNEYDLVVVNQGGWEDVLHAPFKKLYKKLHHYVTNSHNYNEDAVLPLKKQQLLQEWLSHAEMNFGDTQRIFDTIEKKFHIHIDKKQTLVNPIASKPGAEPYPYPAFVDGRCTWVMYAEFDTARKSQDILIRSLSSP